MLTNINPPAKTKTNPVFISQSYRTELKQVGAWELIES
jgi:hypothetical protein